MATERVITVEYLEPSMSKELLGKFPDPSAFDFDYSQSSLWSPLLPRSGVSRPSVDSALLKRLFESSGSKKPVSPMKKLRKIKDKVIQKSTKITGKKRPLEFSSPDSVPRKGWRKIIRAATKRFKPSQRKSPWKKLLPKS